ncbi:MAG TPA: 4-hydroxythreonine-4-phosphate dehydrogenase PdxA [Candidatus Wujingus californicus]|uniref:4-hydroxythreonine-4-phosphate dehydrogenase PdxA n=1 Tax=Candidatus Wujingus californicus TaxID=3367618 RepID=UPI001D93F3A9|nr:4-hydroxythreonine-4-phosphate dehydrogenase PdxA [Planctomycetota bacterium]MDO8095102.1 4-hydroxythreonine-4-phosphate dehydrogenase PdxA [Candidatus Brocadiales bacterium]
MKKEKKSKLLIGITIGDPCGIGPEIILKAIKSPAIRKIANYVIIGNKGVFDKTAMALNIPMEYSTISHISDIDGLKTSIFLLPTGEFKSSLMRQKRATAEGGEVSVQCVIKGINLAMSGHIDALVTAPICKEATHLAGYGYPGHTEMLHIFSGAKRVVMLMAGGKLRVAFVTTHIALKDVPQSITIEDVLETIVITDSGLRQYFGLKKPRIAVCGLNPHAGEEGIFGDEERKVIIPAIEKARKKGIRCDGPLSADTVFYKALKGAYDAVVAIYHDQGAIPLKLHAFETGVNITLGIPFVRTSPDHGTAYDIAGKGIADPRSVIEAIKTAVRIAKA